MTIAAHPHAGSAISDRGASADTAAAALQPEAVLASLGEVVYSWDVESDHITWGANATGLFNISDPRGLASGIAFASLIDAASPTSRHAEVFESHGRDRGTGVPFKIHYLINPCPGVRLWIEDTGRWFADDLGRPKLVHGLCRRLIAPSNEECALVAQRQFDPTTGTLTRADFCNALESTIGRYTKDARGTVLLLLAIEKLSDLNSTYGFGIGDEVIAGVARRMRLNIRKRDTLGRYASNRLGLILAPSEGSQMEMVALRLAAIIRETPIETSAGPIAAEVRIGGVAIPGEARETLEALHACEEALCDAEESTTTPFAAFTRSAAGPAARRDNRESSDVVLSALNDRRIQLAYQPIVSARTGDVAFYECLVRLTDVAGQLLGAGHVVPVAERQGFLHLVDHRVLELAVRTLRDHPRISLTVNVGVDTALHPDWLASLRASLGMDTSVAGRLIVEITETSLIEDLTATRRLVETIKDLGARVAIDDFGAGHTSFRNMRMLPIDILKIDGAFIRNLATSADDRFFVQTLLRLAQHLGIATVAEWVQDEEAATILANWGVEYLQGDFIGRPLAELPMILDPARAVA